MRRLGYPDRRSQAAREVYQVVKEGLEGDLLELSPEFVRREIIPRLSLRAKADVEARLRRLANLGFIRFVKMVEGRGKPKDFYFLSPYGEKAYLAKFNVDVCRVKVESYHSRISHKHVKDRLLVLFGSITDQRRSFQLYGSRGTILKSLHHRLATTFL